MENVYDLHVRWFLETRAPTKLIADNYDVSYYSHFESLSYFKVGLRLSHLVSELNIMPGDKTSYNLQKAKSFFFGFIIMPN